MDFNSFNELSPEARKGFLLDRVIQIVRCFSEMRDTFDGGRVNFECVSDDGGRLHSIVIKCPFSSLAWCIAQFLDSGSTLSIRVEGTTVNVW